MAHTKEKKYHSLRSQYPWFAYESFHYRWEEGALSGGFHFNLSGKYSFKPSFRFENRQFIQQPAEEIIRSLVFHIGLVEMISYWKAACSPTIIIKPCAFHPEAEYFWRKLYFHGLGEFFHTIGIKPDYHDFVKFIAVETAVPKPFSINAGNNILLPIGGGKDSAVSLALLTQANKPVTPFLLNPLAASINTIVRAGLRVGDAVVVKRTIDPLLLHLNQKGFLNGHTPFSALLAFYSLLAAAITGRNSILLSNESSANEATIPGTTINHQYSKSFEFEKDFRAYYQQNISRDLNYFSFLRPINELQVASIFAKLKHYHGVFRSCNAGSKTGTWCGKCSKCLFTFIILSPFLPPGDLLKIFGRNLLDDMDLYPYFEQLCGLSPEKPFDCVGTIDEVNAAVLKTIDHYGRSPLPALLEGYYNRRNETSNNNTDFQNLMRQFNKTHFLPGEFETILKGALLESISEK